MDKNPNKAIAILVCFFLVMMYKQTVWDPYFNRDLTSPSPIDQGASVSGSYNQAAKPYSTSPQTTGTQNSGVSAPTSLDNSNAPLPDRPFPTASEIQGKGIVRVNTTDLSADITLLGGRLSSVQLESYFKTIDKLERFDLIHKEENVPLPLGVYRGDLNDAWVQYDLVENESIVSRSPETQLLTVDATHGSSERAIILRGTLPDGSDIRKEFHFANSGYMVGLSVSVIPKDQRQVPLELEWSKYVPLPEIQDKYSGSGFVWYDGTRATREKYSDVTAIPIGGNAVRWLTSADKFFMATIMGMGTGYNSKVFALGQGYYSRLLSQNSEENYLLVLAPKSIEILSSMGNQLELNIDLGWMGLIAGPLLYLLHFLYGITGNFGVAIVALTIMVKFSTFFLTSASFKQMKAMQDIAPDVQKLRESITDKTQQNAALMDLYKTKGVNPMGGCLPMFLQMPIFIGLYTALISDVNLRHAPFAFWINDLSAAESLQVFGFPIPVMVVLLVISMLIQQWITPSSMDPTQKKIMMVMPIFMGFLFMGFPAGLTIYWLTNNLISIAQSQALHNGRSAKSALGVTAFAATGILLVAVVLAKISG